jgi:hypothetical protein
MATYSKPPKIPRWGDSFGNILEPAEAKKDAGWVFEEVPPSAFENWKEQLNGQWWKWTDERWDDGATNDVLESQMPLGIDTSENFILEDAAGDPKINFRGLAGDSYLFFDESAGQFEIWVGGVKQFHANVSGAFINGDLELGDDLVLPGGLVVGYAGTPVDDRIMIGDDNFFLWGTANPEMRWDDNDYNWYDRTANAWKWVVATTEEAYLGADGLRVLNGVHIGSVTTAPFDNDLVVDGGINVGFAGDPEADRVAVGNASFYMDWNGTDPILNWDADDYIWYDRSNDWFEIVLGTATEVRVTSSGLEVGNGLHVGSYSAPVDNEISATGAINAGAGLTGTLLNVGTGTVTAGLVNVTGDVRTTQGLRVGSGATNPAAGEGIFSDGLVVGYDAAAGASQVRVGDANFKMDYNSGNPRLYGDSDLWMEFNRAGNYAEFSLASGDTFRIDGSIGAMYWGQNATTSFKDTSLAIRYAWAPRNNIRMVCHFSSSGTVETDTEYGVLSVTSPSTGEYRIQVDVGLTYLGDTQIFALPQSSASNYQRICWGRQVSLGGFDTRVEVQGWKLSGTPGVATTAMQVMMVGLSAQ